MASKPLREWTYEEFAQLPDDGKRHEIIAGAHVVSPSPGTPHQSVVFELVVALGPFVKQHRLGRVLPGPVDVLFAPTDYLTPDLVFVRNDRLSVVTERGLTGAPDLVIEVLSNRTARRDRGIKRQRYAAFGVELYWVVDLRSRHVEVYRLAEDPGACEILRDVLRWQPGVDGPVLQIVLADLFGALG